MVSKKPTNILTTIEDLEVTEDVCVFPRWSDLPSPAVENIYSFLNRADQMSMSLVCRNWHKEYSSPSLWRSVTFYVPDIENSSDPCPDVIFARRYGAMFRQLIIVLFPKASETLITPLSLPADSILSQLISFLEAVTRNSQLLSVSFRYIYLWFIRDEETERLSDLYQKILNLMKSQKKLQRIEFTNSEFRKRQAAEILSVIFVNNSDTLRFLNLLGFVEEQNEDQFKDNILINDLNYMALMNLEILTIDYSQIFENMILSFYDSRNKIDIREEKGRLKKIILCCNSCNNVNYLGIPPAVWYYLKMVFPCLRIEVILISPLDPVRFSKYIVPCMPVRALLFQAFYNYGQAVEIGSLLRHMTSCDINESIEDLKVVWKGISPNLATDLISFTNVCPKLEALYLDIEHPVAELGTVFNSWLQNKPLSLSSVKITINLVQTEEQRTFYSNLYDFYAPLLQPLELTLSFVAGKHFPEVVVISNDNAV